MLQIEVRVFFRNFTKGGGGKTDICIFMGGQECFEKIFTH